MLAKLKKPLKWLAICLAIFFILVLILVGTAAALAYKYENKIYPGIRIDNINLGGLTKTQATNIIKGKFKQTYGNGFVFDFKETSKKISNTDEKILSLNLDSQVENIFAEGHKDTYYQKYFKILFYPIFKKQIALDYRLDKELLKQTLQGEFTILEKPAQNSEIEIKIEDETEKIYTFNFTEEKAGDTFHFNEAINKLETAIKEFKNPTIELVHEIDYPVITKEIAQLHQDKINELLQLDNIKFIYAKKSWDIKWSDYVRWLMLTLNDEEQISVQLNPELVTGPLESIAQEIDQQAVNAKLQIKDGRVTEFQGSEDGLKLNKEESLKKINQDIIDHNLTEIELIVEVTEPDVTIGSTNDLGINELLGIGWSDFSGSPANRRHNIGIGAASLHGALIAPNEEFSLINTLGDIDAQSGYKPELVIKKNETIPEYGGGLCQVATTIFRASLQSGMKITSRRNHSYRVGYYEPAGTDATIYNPWPDFKFLNDTKHYVLIQSNISGNTLSFEIWGTPDGRQVKFEGTNTVSNIKNLNPVIYNITSPGPAKEIETTALAPGQKKKTESAHNGADAYFNRYITTADGQEEKETFSSHYIPWQEVWLVGIDPIAKEKEAQEKLAENNTTDDPLITEENEEEVLQLPE